MGLNVNKELARLRKLTPTELRQRYAEVFGEPSRSGNRDFLVKRIIWRTQALDEGDLSERARRRAAEIANDADLRLRPPALARGESVLATIEPKGTTRHMRLRGDDGLPIPGAGALLTRKYRGRTIQVRVLERGFEYEGEEYKSLTAVAKAVTGTHWSGRLFFGLTEPKERAT